MTSKHLFYKALLSVLVYLLILASRCSLCIIFSIKVQDRETKGQARGQYRISFSFSVLAKIIHMLSLAYIQNYLRQ